MAKKYAMEVESLKNQLANAKAWSPKERSAQLFAEHMYRVEKADNPNMTDDDKKKTRRLALRIGRERLGGKKPTVTFSDKEWEAIQAGAVSKTMQQQLFRYADSDKLKERALPRENKLMTSSKLAIAKARLRAGYSYKEIADMLGVSVSTVQRAVNNE
jgi:DNA-binding NarL/FixJ family response regulator